ncbi:hypothetical protein [Zhihengliuella halotolerans]|uniref:Uncharacterized protein n=1 Tax=Zhihengliuella halotolerans TaxID=370736 RepID=A0A4Q8AFJ5_9MICC|nr:hypothetical protein [Zhihengliuella halotolerans]RZU63038.1 hypothetical protein EV380_2645 [Zhihengliuella halotolerans]
MANQPKKSWKQSIKAPLIFSLVLGLIAGTVVTITATGGRDNDVRFDIGLVAFGIAFIASLLLTSLLIMASKDNPKGLGEGSGVNRSSKNPDRKGGHGH